MLTRRDFIKLLSAVGIATQIPPLALEQVEAAPLAPVTPEFQKLFDGQIFRMVFPDGQTYEFPGIIKSLVTRAPVDGLIGAEVSIHPTGPITVLGNEGRQETRVGQIKVSERGISLEKDGEQIGQLQEIVVPRMEHVNYDFYDKDGQWSAIPGLKRQSDITFSVNFTADDGLEKMVEGFWKKKESL